MVDVPSIPRTVLILDDHDIVRQGVRNVVERQLGWTVCGEASDGRQGLALAEELRPDIAVIDISMPGMNGLEAARQIKKRQPSIEILIFSGSETREIIHQVFEAGARSFLPKTELAEHLEAALRALGNHKPYFTTKVSEVVFERYLKGGLPEKRGESPSANLTAREREVVQLVAEGKSSKEIAALLGISLKTVETHRAAIMRKLRLQTLPDLVRYAIRNEIIQA